ncbi:MAG: Unknown protein [uncultured Sulfurovum sp.]|uniref:Uncharacterized protein n=1 Tax=uncultured Sulfurovum sp. TaxID=269237 RepID=A0A6S6SAJ5_9BACT|nr:MAG: Unknown protein [uncultured Sulfurovum sp.]
MGYLLTEIVVYLVIAGLIGFALGWIVKTEVLKKKTKEVNLEVQEKTIEESVELIYHSVQPVLLSEVPVGGQDKLSALKGIGAVLEKKLNELGIYTYAQISVWTTEEEMWISNQIGFPKKVTREEWVKQANDLLKDK